MRTVNGQTCLSWHFIMPDTDETLLGFTSQAHIIFTELPPVNMGKEKKT